EKGKQDLANEIPIEDAAEHRVRRCSLLAARCSLLAARRSFVAARCEPGVAPSRLHRMTRVALLWHMHQPFYQDLVTGEHILPWVRLHALKDYWGMVVVLREFPGVKVTFNLVPSMLVQLEAFAREEARDRHLEIGLKPADQLTDEEKAFCLEHFFHAHRPRMIDPFPRYAELLSWRGSPDGVRARVSQFSTDDYRDLQVWHKLVWIDVAYFERDDRIRALVHKGRGFS